MFLKDDPKITCFLVKVASRCNLNCDYCYVFNHADQSWKERPPLMSEIHAVMLAKRLAEYVEKRELKEFLIVFHGGEPLLMGSEKICNITHIIREAIPSHINVDFSLQTNGVVLREKDVELFRSNKIGVSLSLDGPRKSTDLHRLAHNGSSSFDKVMRSYEILKKYPDVFTGVIAVIDSRVSPQELFTFFNEIDPPQLDFLLPDANYLSPPQFRDKLPGAYQQWLHEAFDLWLDQYSHIPVRFFDSLVASIAGSRPGTDSFGFGDVSLLSIETDGTYHDLDVLKITKDNFSNLGMSLDKNSLYEASLSPKIQAHRKLLSLSGLCDMCKKCPVVDICAGGSVPHRYDGKSFDNPTIYCSEMFSIITHVKKRLKDLVYTDQISSDVLTSVDNGSFDVALYNQNSVNTEEFQKVLKSWLRESRLSFELAFAYAQSQFPETIPYLDIFNNLSPSIYDRLVTLPYVQLWSYIANKQSQGITVFDLDGIPIIFDVSFLEKLVKNKEFMMGEKDFCINKDEPWLRKIFGSHVVFDNSNVEASTDIVLEALEIIKQYNINLYKEIMTISSCIQCIQDPTAHPEKLVSFSDNVLPGALYICVNLNSGFASPYDIADSIIHEHRHQKLYLLEKFLPIIRSELPYVPSPWREEPRPVSGLFHGVFVFVELQNYWISLINRSGPLGLRAYATAINYGNMLREGIKTLKSTNLTSLGHAMVCIIENIVCDNSCLLKENVNGKAA